MAGDGAKGSKALYGASKDAFFKRLLRAEPGIGAASFERIMRRLQSEVVQVRVRPAEARVAPPGESATAGLAENAGPRTDDGSGDRTGDRTGDREPATLSEPISAGEVVAALDPLRAFDPFSPNVVVIVRTSGRERALAALGCIDRVENLRTLAREQQLSIDGALDSASEIRAAIVAAAERRIANRRAAAG